MNRDKYYGTLFYNPYNDRIGIKYDDGNIEDGLHCGQTMEVSINNKWIPTRIEMDEDWYLVGFGKLDSLEGLKVRL